MPVPDFQSLMLPALKGLTDGMETSISELRARIASNENLTPEDLQEMLPGGRQTVFVNRVSWAVIYMERAGLVERVRRAVYQLTPEGEQLLSSQPPVVDRNLLRKYPSYVEWQGKIPLTPEKNVVQKQGDEEVDTPEETLEKAITHLRKTLEAEVLARIRKAPPEFLERAIVHLLIAMGYGGGNPEMGQVTGRSGDGGIDGTIREDALGLDEVYVQAKKYSQSNTVGEGDLRNFAGAIDAAGTTKGVFVTTSNFTQTAEDYVKKSPKRIVLIDGKKLARLMVQHDIGVRTWDSHKVKRIDEDYFELAS